MNHATRSFMEATQDTKKNVDSLSPWETTYFTFLKKAQQKTLTLHCQLRTQMLQNAGTEFNFLMMGDTMKCLPNRIIIWLLGKFFLSTTISWYCGHRTFCFLREENIKKQWEKKRNFTAGLVRGPQGWSQSTVRHWYSGWL